MTGSFVTHDAVVRDQLDWGVLGWVVTPSTAPGAPLAVLDVTIAPGQGHDFHRHPVQHEVITVLSGHVEQWVDTERRVLEVGEAVHVPAGTVHATFVPADADGPAHLHVVLTPSTGESGYEAVDVAGEQPWSSLR
ncbi:hypothetical protein GCM10027047_17700 [Rhodococcus aerolatus]